MTDPLDVPNAFPHLFRPIDLGGLRVRNRLMMTTHGPRLSPARYLRYLEERARGGAGLIGLNAGLGIYVYPTGVGRFLPEYAGDFDAVLPNPVSAEGIAYYDRTVIPALRAQAEAVHRGGSVCVGQLYHPGANKNTDNLQPAVAPSAVPAEHVRIVPHELSVAEIGELVEAFGQGARRVKEAGLDGIEIHAAHGYLLNQFLSPYTNRRTDRYGGSPENRLRFLVEVLEAVEFMVGRDFPVGVRLNGAEFVPGGLSVEDVCEIARRLESRVVYISVSAGNYAGLGEGVGLPYVAPWLVPPGHNVALAAAIKRAVRVPVVVAGRIADPAQAERVLAEGAADLVGMTRALIADPAFGEKARAGRPAAIRPCVAMNECHYPGRPVVCAVNAAAGREAEMAIAPAAVPKRVLVIGGGPAGMEAARVAALRGHAVTLVERDSALGGQIAALARDPSRPELGRFLDYLRAELDSLGVAVRLNETATPETVERLGPDAVVVATGARPHVPPVPGIEGAQVTTAVDVFRGEVQVGGRVLVVGGLEDHLAPLTTACFLADRGHPVTLISELLTVGAAVEPATLHLLIKRLLDRGVGLHPLTGLKAVRPGAAVVFNTFTREERRLEDIDTVVLACGSRAEDGLARALSGPGLDVHVIGDCRAPRRLLHATLDGARVGRII